MVPERGKDAVPVSIVIPAFGAASQLENCLESLSKHAPPGCRILVADDATPDDSVAESVKRFASALSLTYQRRPKNLGFVENCNGRLDRFCRAAMTSCCSIPTLW